MKHKYFKIQKKDLQEVSLFEKILKGREREDIPILPRHRRNNLVSCRSDCDNISKHYVVSPIETFLEDDRLWLPNKPPLGFIIKTKLER